MIFSFDGRTPTVGPGTYVSPTAQVIGDVRIGAGCYIGHGAILRGDYGTIRIGDNCAVEEGVIIHVTPGDTGELADNVTLGHGAIVHSSYIGPWSLVGMGAVVSIRAVVGGQSIVAEGCVVPQGGQVPEGVLVGGIPARVLREITQKDLQTRHETVQCYVDLARKYLDLGMQRVD